MQMILNELSARFPLTSIEEGKQVMEQFINTYFWVKDIIRNGNILLDQEYNSIELAPKYRLEKWRNDPTIDIELKRRFRRILNVSSVYSDREFEEEVTWLMESEFRHEDKESRGCLLAYVLDGVVISFLSGDFWKCDRVKGFYTEIDDQGELYSVPAEVPNVSWEENIRSFKSYFHHRVKEKGRMEIKSGQNILAYKDELLPNLIFCDKAVRQLEKEIKGDTAIQIYNKLLELQESIGKMGKIFQKEILNNATPESPKTLDMFKEEHTIKLPNGTKQLFSWHVRFTGSFAGRIFFEPDLENARIYIGHIGEKLPTAKYH